MNENLNLNPRQEAFVDFYCQTGNVYQSAIKAGYSEKYAKHSNGKILENPNIHKAITMRMEKVRNERIADTQEILEYLTAIMRGNDNDEIVMNVGKGNGITAAEKVGIKISAKDRIRAAEILAKINGLFLNKQELQINSAIPVIIKDDI